MSAEGNGVPATAGELSSAGMAVAQGAKLSPRPPLRTTGQFGVIVFLASDVMLFASFFAAYFLLRSTNDPWPVEGADLDVLRAFIFTMVLVSSSFTMIASDRAHARGDRRGMRAWLIATIALGAAFLANQIAEYITIDFSYDESVYGSIYWGLTGLHAMHVTGGLCVLALLFIRATRTRSLDEVSSWAGGVSMFWHLVDIVWIAVFITIWVIQ
jgi:cytochrome c oxidase subunit 3